MVAARTYECEDTLYAPVRLHTRAHARLSPPLPRRSRRCAGTVGRPCFTTRPWQARPSSSARSVPSKASALPTALVSWWEGRGCTPELLVFSCCRSCPHPFLFPPFFVSPVFVSRFSRDSCIATLLSQMSHDTPPPNTRFSSRFRTVSPHYPLNCLMTHTHTHTHTHTPVPTPSSQSSQSSRA